MTAPRYFLLTVMLAAAAPAMAQHAVPDFSGQWKRSYKINETFDPPPAGLQGPVEQDPRYPATNHEGVPRHPLTPEERAKVIHFTQSWVGDLNSPILTERSKKILGEIDEQELAGAPHPELQTMCMMPGTPAILNLLDGMKMLQTKDQVTFLYFRDHQVRHVYLNRAHEAGSAHTWWGDSVGHYEGNTLVVDTIGENDKTQVDRFGTPHSDEIHVVERYTLMPEAKRIEVVIAVEDALAFTKPWYATAHYMPDKQPFEEIICAENTRGYWPGHPIDIPVATKPDF